ncbi:unnamed protein product [Ranitomeya imitator]|uniref:Protein kinase domain-containing protein n=1 Tax=Ranitomeya imitator TaxID=111125 RepID=A0ABN9MBG7_9NEOB|nr:unnamed protein product [Ranitomeya imitator]
MDNVKNPIDLSSFYFCKELGDGAFGQVILASDPDSEEQLAVKIVEKSHCKKEKVFTEVEILKMATGCRYLMSLRAFTETPSDYLIAMDYMARGDLFDFMVQSKPFDMETTRLFAAEMVCGLQFLHEHGIIHCDLKPENILLDDTGHIKITDFGLSAINVFKGVILKNLIGSKGYIAPEIMDGQGYNHLADSFSFGVILYRMSVGYQPFYCQGSLEEYSKSLDEDVPNFPSEICFDAVDIIEGEYFRLISPMQVPSMNEASPNDMKII